MRQLRYDIAAEMLSGREHPRGDPMLTSHLEACAPGRQEESELRRTVELLSALKLPEWVDISRLDLEPTIGRSAYGSASRRPDRLSPWQCPAGARRSRQACVLTLMLASTAGLLMSGAVATRLSRRAGVRTKSGMPNRKIALGKPDSLPEVGWVRSTKEDPSRRVA